MKKTGLVRSLIDKLVGCPSAESRREENMEESDKIRLIVLDLAGSEEAATKALRELDRQVTEAKANRE